MSRNATWLFACAGAAMLAGMTSVTSAATPYHLTDIGLIAPLSSGVGAHVGAINDAGQVVGDGDGSVFLFSSGVRTEYGKCNNRSSAANGINASGVMAGCTLGTSAGDVGFTHALPPATFNILPITSPPPSVSGINDAGVIVGSRSYLGFRYDGTTLTTINPLPIDADTYAVAINNAGAIAAVSFANFAILHATVVAPGSTTPVPIGSLDGAAANTNSNSFSSAYAINASGQVSGEAYITLGGGASAKHAFLWTSGGTDGVAANPQMKDLGVLPGKTDSHARGMNDAGVVVGYSDSLSSPKAAFVYSGGVMSSLQGLVDSSGTGWTFTEADDVNNVGQIVGLGTFGGKTHGFLLTPVPEPGTALFALLGGSALLWRRQRHL